MKQKFNVIKPVYERVERLEVCIGCGERRLVSRPAFSPIANPTNTQPPSWFNCHVMKLHNFFDISKVEPA